LARWCNHFRFYQRWCARNDMTFGFLAHVLQEKCFSLEVNDYHLIFLFEWCSCCHMWRSN
jgi:hypothetical protein